MRYSRSYKIEKIIKKHETLTTIPAIYVYINKINSRLMFKIKDGYQIELKIPGTKKLFCSTKKLIDKTKKRRKSTKSCLEVVEIVLVQCNLADNWYQQKSEVSCTFTPNKSYVYLLNLVFLKTYNTDFDEMIITFTDQEK